MLTCCICVVVIQYLNSCTCIRILYFSGEHIKLAGNMHKIHSRYEGESISNQPNLFPVEIHLFFFDVIAL